MEISFRPLERSDFGHLEKWLAEPHVKKWWHESFDLVGLERKYGPRIDGHEPTHVFVILINGLPSGIIQYYLWSNYPAHASQLGANSNSAGIDLAIGDPTMIGKGLGSKVISQFVGEIVYKFSKATSVVTDPEEQNLQSVRAFEKAGFKVLKKVQISGEIFSRFVIEYIF